MRCHMPQWYETLFKNYAKKYDTESFTKGTIGECDFIEKEINFDKTKKILDIGCGTGRHSIELCSRGYSISGIDLSESQINHAREKAAKLRLDIQFQVNDARPSHFDNEFDVAIMLCEGGFSLMETDEMNFAILQHATNALKDNGILIFTTLNGLFPLFHSVKDFLKNNSEKGNAQYDKHSFDLMTFRDYSATTFEDDDGNVTELACNERYYVPSEITWLLKTLNYQQIDIYRATLGAFSREDTLTTEDYEMLVIAKK